MSPPVPLLPDGRKGLNKVEAIFKPDKYRLDPGRRIAGGKTLPSFSSLRRLQKKWSNCTSFSTRSGEKESIQLQKCGEESVVLTLVRAQLLLVLSHQGIAGPGHGYIEH